MGLNEMYDQSRIQILMTEPTPSLNKAYAMLVERESQRSLGNTSSNSSNGENIDLAALMIRRGDSSQHYKGTCQQYSGQEYQKGKKNWDQQCEYCKIKGHVKKNCFKLIGYPADWKFKKKENLNTAYNVQAENTQQNMKSGIRNTGEILDKMASGELHRAPHLTDTQHDSILGMINNDNSQYGMMANMAGMAGNTQIAKIKDLKWIVDSGATNHMSSSLSNLTDVKLVKSDYNRTVHLPNGGVTLVTHTGSSKIIDKGELKDVLFVPDFQYNLLSVSKLTREFHCFVSFYPGFCLFQDLSTGRLKEIGKEHDGLYWMVPQNSTKAESTKDVDTKGFTVHDDKRDILLWHRRLAHSSIKSVQDICGRTIDACKSVVDDCEICPLAKQTRLPFTNSDTRSDRAFALLQLDVWGPYNTQTFDGNKYFLTIVDDYSRITWIFLLKFKHDVLIVLK